MQAPTLLATERIASTQVLRHFYGGCGAKKVPASVVAHIYDFVGRSVIWALQVLATPDLPAKRTQRAGRSKRRNANASVSEYIPHTRFKFSNLTDNGDKVVAFCAQLNMRPAIRFLQLEWENFPGFMVAAAAARNGHVNLLNAFRSSTDNWDLIIRQAAIGGHLEQVRRFIEESKMQVTITAGTLLCAFNCKNTLESRIWALKRNAERDDLFDSIGRSPVEEFDIPVKSLNHIIADADPETRDRLMYTIYVFALQTNQRDIALHMKVRCQETNDETPFYVGCSPELWDEMREIDKFHSNDHKKEANFDAREVFAHLCEIDAADPEKCENKDVATVAKYLELAIQRGQYASALRFAEQNKNVLGILFFAAKHNQHALIDDVLEKSETIGKFAKGSKTWQDITNVAVKNGCLETIKVLQTHERLSGPSVDTFKIDDYERVRNAMSDTRDRAAAMKLVLDECQATTMWRICGMANLHSSVETALDTMCHFIGKDTVVKKMIESINLLSALHRLGSPEYPRTRLVIDCCEVIQHMELVLHVTWKNRVHDPNYVMKMIANPEMDVTM